jgi:hypothetical protein
MFFSPYASTLSKDDIKTQVLCIIIFLSARAKLSKLMLAQDELAFQSGSFPFESMSSGAKIQIYLDPKK